MAQASRAPLTGVFFALGGGVILSANDLAIKALSGDYPLHQIILIRAVIGFAIVLAVIGVGGTGFRQLLTRRPWAQLARVSLVMVSNVTYFLGLAALPLADAVAVGFIAPVLITAMSVLVLGERVGPHRWAAVAVGLLGVLVMVRPGSGVMQAASLLVLISAFSYAATHMMTRRMRDTESAMTLNFFVQCGFILVSTTMGLVAGDGRFAGSGDPSLEFLLRPWVWPEMGDWWAFVATGVSVAVGGMMVAQAYRTTEAAMVAPFEYIGMPMAIFWGVVVFGTFPDATGWLGIALICGAGLYTLARETLRRKDVDVAAPCGDL